MRWSSLNSNHARTGADGHIRGLWLFNNQTVVEPSNATLGISEGAIAHNDVNYSAIWFFLPKDTYTYAIFPKTYFGQNGSLTVEGGDVVIQVYTGSAH